MRKLFSGLFEKILCVVFIFIFCQFPAFFSQYTAHLSGHASECTRLIAALEKSTSIKNRTLAQYIDKFLGSSDPDFKTAGELMQALVERQQWLDSSLSKLKASSTFTKPFVFITSLERDIVQETLADFQAQLIFSLETIFYALIGLLFGLGLHRALLRLFTKKEPIQVTKTPE